MTDICSICETPVGDEWEIDWSGIPIHAECAACDCSLGEPHRIADCCREDREVGSDE